MAALPRPSCGRIAKPLRTENGGDFSKKRLRPKQEACLLARQPVALESNDVCDCPFRVCPVHSPAPASQGMGGAPRQEATHRRGKTPDCPAMLGTTNRRAQREERSTPCPAA